jgi:dipeptidase E
MMDNRRAFHPPPNLKGVFVGSGSDGMSDPRIANIILELTGKAASDVTVVYLGTATYDLPAFQKRQTQCFADMGCTVTSINLVTTTTAACTLPNDRKEIIELADVIVVGGGNTLFAVDRWRRMGLVPHLERARDRGCVLTGGSAGAICWFDGGHSDSMDPDTYQTAMMEKFGSVVVGESSTIQDESSAAPTTTETDIKSWKYIRVAGLGFLPGLLCPHHDRTQSNGVLRAHDFDQMLLRHEGELGIGIDHWAALVVDGDSYRVVSLEGKPGSVVMMDGDDGNTTKSVSPDASGVPGVWIKNVIIDKGNDTTTRMMMVDGNPIVSNGKLSALLQLATKIVGDDEAVEQCRGDNPDTGPVP